jgi:hypothetical protein
MLHLAVLIDEDFQTTATGSCVDLPLPHRRQHHLELDRRGCKA